MKNKSNKVAEPSNSAKKTVSVLLNIVRGADAFDDFDVIIGYILFRFIQLIARNYNKFFVDESVSSFISAGINYSDRYLVCFDSDGEPVNTAFEKGNYTLPELDNAVGDILGHGDVEEIFECVMDFVYHAMDEDAELRNSVIKFFEEYLADAWGGSSVKLEFSYAYVSIEVTRDTSEA